VRKSKKDKVSESKDLGKKSKEEAGKVEPNEMPDKKIGKDAKDKSGTPSEGEDQEEDARPFIVFPLPACAYIVHEREIDNKGKVKKHKESEVKPFEVLIAKQKEIEEAIESSKEPKDGDEPAQ